MHKTPTNSTQKPNHYLVIHLIMSCFIQKLSLLRQVGSVRWISGYTVWKRLALSEMRFPKSWIAKSCNRKACSQRTVFNVLLSTKWCLYKYLDIFLCFEMLLSSALRVYLMRVICNNYGLEILKQLAATPCFHWIMSPEGKEEMDEVTF